MNNVECLFIPIAYVLVYIAGKYDLIGMICEMLEQKLEEMNEEDENEQN